MRSRCLAKQQREGEGPAMVSESSLQQTFDILRRRRRLIISLAVGGAILAVLVGLLIPPRYTAKAEIVVEPQVATLTNGPGVITPPSEDESTVQTYVAALTSRDHLQHVLDSLSRDAKPQPAALQQPASPAGFQAEMQRITARLEGWWTAVTRLAFDILSQVNGMMGVSNLQGHAAKQPSVETLERHLAVYQERGSHVLAVAFTSTSADEAARTANRVIQLYLDDHYQIARESASRTLAWVDQRLPEQKAEMERNEATVQQYRSDHNIAQGNQTDIVDQKLADLNRQLTAAESLLAEKQAQADSARALRHGGSAAGESDESLNSPVLRDLRRQELTLLQAQADLTTNLGEMHPRTRAIATQLQEVRSRIGREAGRAADELNREVEIAGTQVRSLRARLATAQHATGDVQQAQVHLHELERVATTSRQMYEGLLQRHEQLKEQLEMIVPDVRILSLAVPPDRPSSPNPILFAFPALIVFGVGGGLLSLMKERLDQGLRSSGDITEVLGIPCIGLVPRIGWGRIRRPHQHLLRNPISPYAEAIRSLAAGLQLAAPRAVPQAILVSSSVPQEGKTTLAVSLAVYAALLGRRVVLADLDFRHPAVWSKIGDAAAAGALDLPNSDRRSTVELRNVHDLGLDVLTIRDHPAEPLATFTGDRLVRIVDELRVNYDCIIIDGPPLLSVAEARLLTILADKVLFVVKWGSTRRDVAQNALRILRDTYSLNASYGKNICGVITQVDLNKHARYRYGDAAESYVRYAQYYLNGPSRSRLRAASRARLTHDDGKPPQSAISH
jgi:uncharacterized protein involved in exopolysaccharide biosynthesis/Mrp family chromosome partitioning ATPase